nr:hypothetical protein [Tanacetum cinerariifolium]
MANPNPEDPNVPNEDVPEEDPYHLLDYDKEEDPKMDIEEEEPEEDPPGNMNGWVDDNDDVEEDDDAEIIFPYEVQGDQTPPLRDESSDSEFEAEEADDELKVEEAGVEPEDHATKPMSEARMREIIRDQFATSMNELMANMNNGAGGSGGVSGSGGAGGSGGIGGNADGTGVRGARPTVPELTGTKAMGIEAANNTPWIEVKKWMTEEFCPRSVIQRMEQELYNLRMKGMDIDGYTNRFHELALLCPRMVEPEAVKVEQYLRGLTKSIHGDVTSSQPATIDDAVHLAYQLVGQLIQDKADEATEEMSCYNGHEKGHKKKDCPKLGRNGQGGNNRGGAYRLGAVNAQEDPKVVTGTSYEVELADGKIVSTNNVLKGCTLNLLNHSFPIDLMVIELGIFDVLIGMDWLSKNDVAILCGEKKARKYIENGCELFLAQVTETVSKEKRVKDVPVIRDFPEVFPKDLPGLPPPRQVEFCIDLIPGATPVA